MTLMPSGYAIFSEKSLKIFVVLAFAFPAVAVVRVVRGENHDAALVIEDHAMMRLVRIGPLPGDVAALPNRDAGNLVLGFDVEHTMIQRMLERQIDPFAVRKHSF